MTAKKQPQPKQEPQEEPYTPMGVMEPSPVEQLEALTIRVRVLETQYRELEGLVSQHNRYHFGRTT